MRKIDRIKDDDGYMYIIDGEPALLGDELEMGLIPDWNKRYEDSEVITNILLFDLEDRVIDEHHVAYTKDGKHLLNCLNDFNGQEYTVKEGTTTICDEAFSFRANPEQRMTLYIPRSVKIIGENLFGDGGGRIVISDR